MQRELVHSITPGRRRVRPIFHAPESSQHTLLTRMEPDYADHADKSFLRRQLVLSPRQRVFIPGRNRSSRDWKRSSTAKEFSSGAKEFPAAQKSFHPPPKSFLSPSETFVSHGETFLFRESSPFPITV